MQKDQSYHESAIAYNEGLAEFAENLALTLEHEEVRKWCVAVGKQHRFHAKRHRSALNKLLLKQIPAPVEVLADGLDVPELPAEAEVTASDTEVEEILMPETEVESLVSSDPVQGEPTVLPDGCWPFHNPTDTNCEFYPTSEEQ